MKIAYILRGVPGSGKTTLAKTLAGSGGVIHSTDEYFMEDGVYRFTHEKLVEFHNRNFTAFKESVLAGIPVVVCDNVNRVAIVFLPHPSPDEAAARTVHGVPIQTISRIIERWEY